MSENCIKTNCRVYFSILEPIDVTIVLKPEKNICNSDYSGLVNAYRRLHRMDGIFVCLPKSGDDSGITRYINLRNAIMLDIIDDDYEEVTKMLKEKECAEAHS